MKNIKKHFHAIVLLLGLLISTNACEDLAFGDKFLQKPPSTDVTIDTVFSTAEYARRVLWYSYRYLPMDWKHRIVIGTRCGWEILKA